MIRGHNEKQGYVAKSTEILADLSFGQGKHQARETIYFTVSPFVLHKIFESSQIMECRSTASIHVGSN
jgi:hypothetical protein